MMKTAAGRALGEHFEPLAVSPKQACLLLSVGNTRLYQLIGSGELETYKEGRSTKVTMRSIRARHERQLAAHGATELAQPRRRGRPRRVPLQPADRGNVMTAAANGNEARHDV